jgi:hypothetical protein
MRTRVVASGIGVQQTPNRGRLEISSIDGVDVYEQSSLFTFERASIADLIERQGLAATHGAPLLLEDVTTDDDDEVDAFIDALLEG